MNNKMQNYVNLKRTVAGTILLGLLATNALADTLSSSQVGNVSANGNSLASLFLTANWGDGSQNVGLIQFDLTSFAGQTVSNATLNLYQQNNGAQGAVFDIFQNTSAWNPSSTSLSSAPSFNPNPIAVLTLGDNNSGVWRSVNVTSAVNSWAKGTPNYGFTLERVDQANPYVYFSSTSNAYGGFAPTLAIAALPEPETYVMMLSGFGLLGFVARRRKNKEA